VGSRGDSVDEILNTHDYHHRFTAPIHNEPFMIIQSPINNLAELRPGNMSIDAAIHSYFRTYRLINQCIDNMSDAP